MSITRTQLNGLGFQHTHNVEPDGDLPRFISRGGVRSSKKPTIYAWVSPIDESTFDLLYVGKAGYGVQRRMDQHMGGFVNSTTGRKNRELINGLLAQNRAVQVFARESEKRAVLGVEVSLYSAEEEAMCQVFSPLWNRAGFPDQRNAPVARLRKRSSESSSIVLQAPIKSIEDSTRNAGKIVGTGLPPPTMDFSHMNCGDDAAAFFDSLLDGKKKQFVDIFNTLEQLGILQIFNEKIVDGYTRQPSGYNGTPMIVFCRLKGKFNASPHSWMFRIPLVDSKASPLTVILPDRIGAPKLPESKIVRGAAANFKPVDLQHFLNHPELYISLEKLQEQIRKLS